MADTRQFSSDMVSEQTGHANLNFTVNGEPAGSYNPYGPDTTFNVPVPAEGGAIVFVTLSTTYNEVRQIMDAGNCAVMKVVRGQGDCYYYPQWYGNGIQFVSWINGVNQVYDWYNGGWRHSTFIPTNNAFIDCPSALGPGNDTIDESTTGQAKYTHCMELLGLGIIPVARGRLNGPNGTAGSFGMLAYINDDCEIVFRFSDYASLSDDHTTRLTPAGFWYFS
jgi:hypothetical protein